LRALHEKYKNDEYAPDKETPGFKLPRRIKVEWVSASPDSDYYKKAAGRWILSTVAGIPSDPWLATALLAVPVLREYSEQAQFGRLRLPPWTERDFATSLYSYAYLQRPQSAASVVGQIGGAVSTAVAPMAGFDSRYTATLSVLVGQQASAVALESKDMSAATAEIVRGRGPLAGAFLAANPMASPLANAKALSGVWEYAKSIDQYLPFQVVKNQVLRKVEQSLASNLVTSSLAKFKQELESKRHRPAEAAKFVSEQI